MYRLSYTGSQESWSHLSLTTIQHKSLNTGGTLKKRGRIYKLRVEAIIQPPTHGSARQHANHQATGSVDWFIEIPAIYNTPTAK